MQQSSITRRPSELELLRGLAAFSLVLAIHPVVLAEGGSPPSSTGSPQDELAIGHDDLATKWKVNDADPMASIPTVEQRNADPLEFGYYLQDMLHRAEGAYRKHDWKNAIKYYRPLANAVPTVARSHSRLCDAYARAGEMQLAIESCRQALTLKGAKVIDHLRFVDLVLRKHSFGSVDAEDVNASLDHLREHARLHPQALPGSEPIAPAGEAPVVARPGWNARPELTEPKPGESADILRLKERAREILEGKTAEPEPEVGPGAMHLPTQIELASCRLAVRTADQTRLAECMGRLREYELPEKALLPFRWAGALQRKDEAGARELVEEARRSGATEEILAGMLVEQEKIFGTDWSARLSSAAGIIAVLGVTLLVLGAAFFGRRAKGDRLVTSSSEA